MPGTAGDEGREAGGAGGRAARASAPVSRGLRGGSSRSGVFELLFDTFPGKGLRTTPFMQRSVQRVYEPARLPIAATGAQAEGACGHRPARLAVTAGTCRGQGARPRHREKGVLGDQDGPSQVTLPEVGGPRKAPSSSHPALPVRALDELRPPGARLALMRKALSVRRVPGDRKLASACQGAPAEMHLPQTRTHGTRGPLREPAAPRLSHGTPTLTNPDSHPDLRPRPRCRRPSPPRSPLALPPFRRERRILAASQREKLEPPRPEKVKKDPDDRPEENVATEAGGAVAEVGARPAEAALEGWPAMWRGPCVHGQP